MKFASIGSGSRGNAMVIEADGTRVLLDCGINFKQLSAGMARLDLDPAQLDAVLLTHEHGDHIKGLKSLLRKCDIPAYMTYGTALAADCLALPQLRLLENFSSIQLGSLLVEPVAVPHDAREPCQFVLTDVAAGSRLGVLTDLGSYTPHVVDAFSDCDALVLESNHDEQMLREGPYPGSLKRRVLGEWGHLSNGQAQQLLAQCAGDRLQWLVVAHISQQNNTTELAMNALAQAWPRPERIVIAGQDFGFDWLSIDTSTSQHAAAFDEPLRTQALS